MDGAAPGSVFLFIVILSVKLKIYILQVTPNSTVLNYSIMHELVSLESRPLINHSLDPSAKCCPNCKFFSFLQVLDELDLDSFDVENIDTSDVDLDDDFLYE